MNDDIQLQIDHLEREIAELERYLPYADGPAYYQDLGLIRHLKQQLEVLKRGQL